MPPLPREFTVEALAAADVDAVVRVHLRAFPEFFLSFLGPRFLRVFYGSFPDDPIGLAYVARAPSGEVLGAVVGPLNPQGYFRRLLARRWWAFCSASAVAVLRRPGIIPKLCRAVFYRGDSPPGGPRALLSSVAVAPEAQGMGVGRSLVERWVAGARARGARGCFLTTDAQGNESVNAFYRKLGWKVEATYSTPEGRSMNRYVLDF